jgi:CheY-like chemotaxis protein
MSAGAHLQLERPRSAGQAARTEAGGRPRRRILVVDDNPDILNSLRRALLNSEPQDDELLDMERKLFGDASSPPPSSHVEPEYMIDVATQGEEAIALVEAATADPYLLAFIDVRMPPGMDGIQTVKRLWQRSPDLYAIVCTAYSDYTFESITNELGASPNLLVLNKPFEAMQVRQIAACVRTMYDMLAQFKLSLDEMATMATGLERERTRVQRTADAIADLSGLAVLSVDATGHVRDATSAAARRLGRPRAELVGTSLATLVEDAPGVPSLLQPGTHRVLLLTPSGALSGVELTTHAVHAPNNEGEVLIVLPPS